MARKRSSVILIPGIESIFALNVKGRRDKPISTPAFACSRTRRVGCIRTTANRQLNAMDLLGNNVDGRGQRISPLKKWPERSR